MPTKIVYTPHYEVVGGPAISDDYIASGLSSTNYFRSTESIPSTANTWELGIKFHTGTSFTGTAQYFVGNTHATISVGLWEGSPATNFGDGSWFDGAVNLDTSYAANTDYWYSVSFDGTKYSIKRSTDGENFTEIAYLTNSNHIATTLVNIGYQPGSLFTSIDLKEVYMKVDGVETWRAVTWEEVDVSGSVSVSKGYYDNGSNKIQITSAMTKNLSELSSGETIGCKNKLFAYSKNDAADIRITADSNADISTSHDVSVKLDKNVYLSCLKNYIVGHTPLQTIPMQIGGELTPDYTASDTSVINSDYILTSSTSGKYVYKSFSESDVTTAEVTVKCKQTSTKYRSDIFSGWGIVGFCSGYLGVWNGSNWMTGTYYPAGTWVWVKAISTPASSNIKIYGLVDNGYTLDTLPDISQWDLCHNGGIAYGNPLANSLYIPDAGSSEWFDGQVDLKEVQVKKNGVEIWRAIATPANGVRNSSNGFVYDSINDKTFWYPTETILELRNFTDLQDRCNLYLANEDGKDVSRFLAGSSLPGPVKTNYVVEGSPIINSSYEASNFTNSNYLSIPETIPSTNGTTIITAISLTGSPPSDTGGILSKTTGVPNVYIHDSMKLGCYDGDYSQAGSTTMLANTKYWLGIRYYSSDTQFFLLQDNNYTLDTLPAISNWNLEFSFSNKNEFGGSNLYLGKLNGGLPFTVGTIYLADTAIATNGVYVWKAVEQNPVIASSIQQGYVYLNHAHNKVIGIGDEPDEIILEASNIFQQPVLSSAGTLGGDSFAIYYDHNTEGSSRSYYAFRDFDDYTGGENDRLQTNNTSTSTQHYLTMYNPYALRVSSIKIRNATGAYSLKDYTVYGSNDNSSWVTLTTGSNSNTTDNDVWTISVDAATSYKYIRLGFYPRSSTAVMICRVLLQATYEANTVEVSSDHYWTYLQDDTYDVQGATLAVSSMSPSALTGHLMMTTAGVLSYSEVNAQLSVGGLLPGAAYTGYDVTFTDNTYTAIDSVDKVGTRYRIYRSAGTNPEAPIEFVAMSYDDYGSFAGGALPSASESYGLTVDSPIEYTSTTTFTLSTDEIQGFDYYNPTEDKFYVYETGLWTGYQALSYIGDMYIIDSTGA